MIISKGMIIFRKKPVILNSMLDNIEIQFVVKGYGCMRPIFVFHSICAFIPHTPLGSFNKVAL